MSVQDYKTQFETFLSKRGNEPKSLLNHRNAAFNNFVKLGFPTKKSELWQYTDLSPIIKSKYDFIDTNDSDINDELFKSIEIPNSMRIVIENGRLNNVVSDHDSIIIKNSFDSNIDLDINTDKNSFIALNSAFATGGYSIEIGKKYNSEQPLHIINIITDNKDHVQNHQINYISIDNNSSVTIIEEFIHNSDNKIFSNIVNHVNIKENSHLNYVAFQM